MGVGGQQHTPIALSPGKRPVTYCIEGWVGLSAGLDRYGKSRLRRGGVFDPRTESLYRLLYPGALLLHK